MLAWTRSLLRRLAALLRDQSGMSRIDCAVIHLILIAGLASGVYGYNTFATTFQGAADGVMLASYLDQSFRDQRPATRDAVREATVAAGLRRIRPCLITTATTILALLPVLTSRGRGSDVMGPMAIPCFGGMLIELMTLFFVPVTYCLIEEIKLRFSPSDS